MCGRALGQKAGALRWSVCPPGGLVERHREQAGAQQHQARCGQRQETVGHQVMITHDTPAVLHLPSRCSSELIKNLRISFCERGAGWFAGVQALERKPSKAWARKMPALTRPRTAVIVSIIANVLCAPAGQNDTAGRTVKRIPGPDRKSGRTDDLVQQSCSGRPP